MSVLPSLRPDDPEKGIEPPRFLPFSKAGPLVMASMIGVVALALLLLLLRSTGEAPAAPGPAPGPAPDDMTKPPQLQFLDEGELAAQWPETVRDELQSEILEWFQQTGRQAISDRSAELEDEWVRHFLSSDVRPRLERLPGWVFGALGDGAPDQLARIVDEPGPHRGRLVRIWGAVRTVEEVPLPTDPPTPGWRVRMDDAEGRAWTVVTTKKPPATLEPGGWFKAYGVFVKLWPVEEGRPSFLVLAEQTLVPSYPPVATKEISPSWAEDVEDADPTKCRRPGEEDAFWSLMNYVRTMGPAGYQAKLRSGELKVTDLTGPRGATELAQKPALHRFELVRLRVGIARGEGAFVTDQDLPENVGNIASVFRGFVIDDQQRVIWVMTPFAADQFRIGDARLAVIEGFFYKRMAVDMKSGKGKYWMPVLVGTGIYPVDTAPRESHAAAWAAWIAIAGAVTCAFLYVILSVRTRRTAEETRRRHEQRVRERAAGKRHAT